MIQLYTGNSFLIFKQLSHTADIWLAVRRKKRNVQTVHERRSNAAARLMAKVNIRFIYKPGSVPSTNKGRWPFIWAGRYRPARATYPDRHVKTRDMRPLFGLAFGGVCLAGRCCQSRGALLPHRFTLTLDGRNHKGRSVLCCTFHRLAPSGRYPAPCSHKARTFLP